MHVVEPVSLSAVVTLVNEWGAVPRAVAGEESEPYPAPHTLAGLGKRSHAELVRLADLVHPVFAAADPAERAGRMLELTMAIGLRPWLGVRDGTMVAGWQVPRRSDLPLAAVVVPVYEHLARYGALRLGVCAAHRCADAYVDLSRPGKRRYCSVSCQNRERVAAFRAGRRPTDVAGGH